MVVVRRIDLNTAAAAAAAASIFALLEHLNRHFILTRTTGHNPNTCPDLLPVQIDFARSALALLAAVLDGDLGGEGDVFQVLPGHGLDYLVGGQERDGHDGGALCGLERGQNEWKGRM